MSQTNGTYGINAQTVTSSTLLKTGGGCLTAPFVITAAGSADSCIRLFDGINASGTLIATQDMASVGPRMAPNYAFRTGLFVQITGATPGTARITWS